MPCFKGLAVSIHTPEGPIPEYSIQKQSRQSRIASYIPVPPPKINPGTARPEQSSFAISITLLTPGSVVPYSRPQPTTEDPFPRQKLVGGLPGSPLTRGIYDPVIGPYIPLTPSPNETVAAYIHFDGRAKEEVATLLRRGVETWVNSRWVSVPDSEGGGLAEREFLFREVGLERWLNGLDLEGESKDVAARVERRKQRLEKRRRKRVEVKDSDEDDDDDDPITRRARPLERHGVLRYGDDKHSPVESLPADEGLFSSDSDSEDEVPLPEAAGQIKVSLFRVLASGEIKKGEYSPQFDAHDDDESMQEQNGESSNCDADVDHTTTFAKPKTLDPKSISTQTVTGIDPPDKPYATFTFFYRGEKQLQKMGILPTPEPVQQKPTTAKRKSRQIDFSTLGPLKAKGTVGFAGYRDATALSPQSSAVTNGPKKNPDEMDSDADDEDERRPNGSGQDDVDLPEVDAKVMLSPEEFAKRAELAEGVKKMQLKRQHSFEARSDSPTTRKNPSIDEGNPNASLSPVDAPYNPTAPIAAATTTPSISSTTTPRLTDLIEPADLIGSPFKKHRASVASSDALNFSSFAPKSSSGLANGGSSSSNREVGLGIKQEIDEAEMAAASTTAAEDGPAVKREDGKMGVEMEEEL